MRSITFTVNVPDDLEARIKDAGRVQWGAVEAQVDVAHLMDFERSINLTREHFGLTDDLELHGLYLEGTNIVLAHTGVSPNSPMHAQLLTGLWNALLTEIEKPDADPQ